MGDEGGVMKLLMEIMTYLEDHTRLDGSGEPIDLCAPSPAEPSEPEPSRSETCAPYLDDDEYMPPARPPPASSAPPHSRLRLREERRRVLRLASDKLTAIEERERTLRREKDLRQQILLQNMAARLEAEARAERACRQTPRPPRSYSRTLGRSFCSRPPTPTPTDADAAAAARPESKKRRRADPPDDLLEADVHELLGELAAPAPGDADDDDEALSKRLRLFPLADGENADPNCGEPGARLSPPAPQEQVRLGAEPAPVGCAAAAGFADFQHCFHQLVPSLES